MPKNASDNIDLIDKYRKNIDENLKQLTIIFSQNSHIFKFQVQQKINKNEVKVKIYNVAKFPVIINY